MAGRPARTCGPSGVGRPVRAGELTARLVARHAGVQGSPLGAVGDIVVGPARLLEEEVLVRPAARLARELPDAPVVRASFRRPRADELLARARQARGAG